MTQSSYPTLSDDSLKFFWALFIKENKEYIERVQKHCGETIRKILDEYLVDAGLNPVDFHIVWNRPEIEFRSSPTSTKEMEE